MNALISCGFYILMILAMLITFGFLFNRLVLSSWKHFGRIFGCAAFYPRYIGTPVHETGHLIFALLTGSKIKNVKLFPVIDKQGRRCGGAHVIFIPRSGLIGSLSMFLSGIGPMLFCPFVILVLMHFLVPGLYTDIIQVIQTANIAESNLAGAAMLYILSGFFRSFHLIMLANWKFWLFLFLAIPIANECVLSSADIKSARKGFLILLGLFLFAGFILSLFPSACLVLALYLKRTAALLLCILCLAFLFNLLHWIIGSLLAIL